MTTIALFVLVFAGVTTLVAGAWTLVWDVWFRDQELTLQRVDREFGLSQQSGEDGKPRLFKDLGLLACGLGSFSGASWSQWLNGLIEQAGFTITSRQFLGGTSLLGAVAAGLVGWWQANAWLGIAAGVAALFVPLIVLLSRRLVRQQRLLRQLPEVLDLMARTLSSGHTLMQSFQEIAREFRPPISIEFALCAEQHRLGLPLESALEDLAHRTGILEMRVLAMALLVQQQSGGNLGGLLQRLSGLVRERFRILGKIKTLTAEGRMQAAILMAMPPGLFLMLYVLRREYVLLLFKNPMLVMIVLVGQVIGCLWIKHITAFDNGE